MRLSCVRHLASLEFDILNDFEATALSLPLLTAGDLYPVGGGEAALGAPMAVLGPGTGLGVACFVPGSQALSSQAKAVTRLWQLPQTVKMRSSTICAGSSVTYPRRASSFGRRVRKSLSRAVIAIDGIEAPKRNAAEITNAATGWYLPSCASDPRPVLRDAGNVCRKCCSDVRCAGRCLHRRRNRPAAHRIHSTLWYSSPPFRTQRAFQAISRIHSVKHHRTSGCDVHGLEGNCGTRRYDK